MDGVEQLHESGFAVTHADLALAVTGHDLAEEGDFLHPGGNESAAFRHDIFNTAAAFLAACVGNDAEGAVLIAALHDAHESAHLATRRTRRAECEVFLDGA